jgi:hypothetical protein
VHSVPNYYEGYTTDDNARFLIVTVYSRVLKASLKDGLGANSIQRAEELGQRLFVFSLVCLQL